MLRKDDNVSVYLGFKETDLLCLFAYDSAGTASGALKVDMMAAFAAAPPCLI